MSHLGHNTLYSLNFEKNRCYATQTNIISIIFERSSKTIVTFGHSTLQIYRFLKSLAIKSELDLILQSERTLTVSRLRELYHIVLRFQNIFYKF